MSWGELHREQLSKGQLSWGKFFKNNCLGGEIPRGNGLGDNLKRELV